MHELILLIHELILRNRYFVLFQHSSPPSQPNNQHDTALEKLLIDPMLFLNYVRLYWYVIINTLHDTNIFK